MRQERRGFLSLSIRTAPPPPCTQRAAGPRGARLRLPGSPWAPRSGVASRVRRLLPGYVLSLFRQTFSGGLYIQARAAAVDRNTERPARGEKEGRAPSNAGARRVAPPPPAGTRAVSQRWAPGFRGLDARRGDPQSWRDRRAALGPFPRPRRVRSARISPNAPSAKNRATRRAARAPRQGVSDGRDRSTGRGPRVGCFGSGGVAIPGTVPDVQGAAFPPAPGSLWGCGLCPPRATALSARVSVSVSTPRLCR